MGFTDNGHFSMNSGDGPLSYVKNSSYQGGVLEAAKAIIEEEIATKLEISSTQKNTFCIADFGCSTGNNSFPAIDVIIEAIKRKHESSEFHVFFNDAVTNDFNTLFRSLPPERGYKTVAALPGDFHGRLLPPSSLHFAYSSWSLHWLTEAPKAVADPNSTAWNGGEIFYSKERKEVYDAYLDKFEKDLESFLKWRALEMVDGALMALLIPGVLDSWDPQKEFTVASMAEPIRSSLVNMAKKGKLEEAKIDTFNIPYYFPNPEQLRAILQKSKTFSIERRQILKTGTLLTANGRAAMMRAVHQGLLAHHFGAEIIDELFDLYEEKLAASPLFSKPDNDATIVLLVILKRRKRNQICYEEDI